MRRIILALFLLVALGASASAVPWTITDSYSTPRNISNNSQLIVVMQAVYEQGGETYPVVPEECSTIRASYNYNTTENQKMAYIPESPGYYYANFTVNTFDTSAVLYAEGTCDGVSSDDTATDTVTFNAERNLSVVANTTYDRRFLEGESYTIWANITHNNEFHNADNVNWSVWNWQGMVDTGNMGQRQGYYEATIDIPSPTERFYYLDISARNSSATFKNATGGTGLVLPVQRLLDGEIEMNNSGRECNQDTTVCQKNASINVTANITAAFADTMDGSVTGSDSLLTDFDFNKMRDGIWTGNFTVPGALNTTVYGTELVITADAENRLSSTTLSRTLTIDPFDIIVDTASYVFQGNTIDLVFGPTRAFTEIPIQREHIDWYNVSIDYPNGTRMLETNVGEDGPIDDENYLSGQRLLTHPASIPTDAPAGTYDVNVFVQDTFGEIDNTSFSFEVYDAGDESTNVSVKQIGSGISSLDQDTLQKQFDSPGYKQGSIILNNNGTESASVRIHLGTNLSGLTSYDISYLDQSGTPIDLQADSSAEIEFNFSLQERKRYRDTLTFMVEGNLLDYNRSLDVNFTVGQPGACVHENGSLCVETAMIDELIQNEDASFNISVINNGESTNISYRPEGNISQIIGSGEEDYDAEEQRDMRLPLDVTGSDNSWYEGNITLENSENKTVRVPAEILVDIPSGELNLTVPSPDLGSYLTGVPVTFNVTLTNEGETTIHNITLENGDLGFTRNLWNDEDPDRKSLEPGESFNVELQVDASGLGSMERGTDNPLSLTATSESGLSSSDDIYLTIIEDLSDDISGLQGQISTFRQDVESIRQEQGEDAVSDIQSDIDEMETAYTQADEAWAAGNYQEARDQYNTATELQSQISTSIEEAQTSDGGGNNGEPGTNETNGGTDPGGGNGGDGGGGLPIFYIVIVLVILIVVGIIAYLSIVPEESERGDAFSSESSDW